MKGKAGMHKMPGGMMMADSHMSYGAMPDEKMKMKKKMAKKNAKTKKR